MSNYFNDDFTHIKAYTNLEIKIDFFKVIEESLKRTVAWKKLAEKAKGQFKYEDCPAPNVDTYYQQMWT